MAQGLTGFGFGILAMAGLTPIVGPQAANLIVTPLAGANIAIALWHVRREITWRHALPLWLGGLVGTPLGVYVLLHADPLLLRRLVGAVILAAAVSQTWRAAPRASAAGRRWGFAAGALGGIMGGAVAMAGPPVAVYVYRQPWPLARIKATILLYFAWTVAHRMVLFAGSAAYSPPLIRSVLSLLPLVLLTSWAGARLTGRIPRKTVDRTVALLLLFASIWLLAAR